MMCRVSCDEKLLLRLDIGLCDDCVYMELRLLRHVIIACKGHQLVDAILYRIMMCIYATYSERGGIIRMVMEHNNNCQRW